MSRIILVIAVLLFGLGVSQWQKKQDPLYMADTSIYGFVEVNPSDGVSHKTVLILTPLNCPSELAQRANRLYEALKQDGIPVERSNRYSSEIENPTPEQLAKYERWRKLWKKNGPLVLIGGWAKVSPSVDEVKGEYQQRVATGR